MKNNFLLFIILISFGNLFSQSPYLGDFDDKPVHFGFALGFNQPGFYLEKKSSHVFLDDSLQSLLVSSKGGFTLGVITSLNISQNFKIRFVLPSLSFQESEMEYTYLNPSNFQPTVYVKSLRPVYLDFPVLFKFRTNRINNFAVYGIAGFRYGIDMSSNIDVNNSIDLEDQIIKLKKHDFGSEIGGGVDLFLEYFKLGIELKLGSGMRNMLYNTPGEVPTKFDNAIESLRSRVWTLSFTFEG
tara:strand:+ start:323 stop:1048 length:726 start_codon:yes stop_codon:yes gene_type:complete